MSSFPDLCSHVTGDQVACIALFESNLPARNASRRKAVPAALIETAPKRPGFFARLGFGAGRIEADDGGGHDPVEMELFL